MKLLGRVAAAIVVVVVLPVLVLAMLEGTLGIVSLVRDVRALPPAANPLQARYDSLVGWIAAPNLSRPNNFGPALALTTDANGLRVHTSAAATKDARSLVCSGDEIAFGIGVSDDDTFCARLERLKPRIRTRNLAQRGYDLAQSLLLYERDLSSGQAVPQKPTSPTIDLFGVTAAGVSRLSEQTLAGYPKPQVTTRAAEVLVASSVHRWSAPSRSDEIDRVVNESRFVQLIHRISGSPSADRRSANGLHTAESVVRNLATIDSAHGRTLVLAFLPTQAELDPGRGDSTRARLADVARSARVAFVDLVPEMRALPVDTVEWMFIASGARSARGEARGYTARGHQWVAEHLIEHLARLDQTRGRP